MSQFWKLYALTVPVFLALDAVWLGVVARGFYRGELGGLLRADVRWGAAALFYLLYAAGIVIFVVAPSLDARGGVGRAMLVGGFLGALAYGAYDLTNLATLRGFTVRMAAVDMVWGTLLTAGVTGAVLVLARALHLEG